MENENQRWDFIIIGGGIAGLAIAELLQRSGASVLLLEKNKTLCSQASAEQQGWFHTGALYTALPGNFFCRTLVGNLDDLIDYYRVFPNMNLRVDKHIYTADRNGWFSNRTNFYLYSNSKGVAWKWKIPWTVALHRAKRRMSWFEMLDASRSLSHQMGFGSKPIKSVVHASRLGVSIDNVAFTLKSRDRAMNTQLIATDLLRSYIGCGGTIRTQTQVRTMEQGKVTATNGTGDTLRFHARHVILAAGKESQKFSDEIRVFLSPLLVVLPALTDISFVNMSPHMEQTINHIYHHHAGLDYSVIGNAAYYTAYAISPEVLREAAAKLSRIAKRVFPDLDDRKSAIFYGYKTELTRSPSIRNYLYHIQDNQNYTLALPGKFSLCFSLAANVCRHFGIEPVSLTGLTSDISVEHLVAYPRHHQIASDLAAELKEPINKMTAGNRGIQKRMRVCTSDIQEGTARE